MFNKTRFDEFLISSEMSNFTYIDMEYSSNSKHYYKEKFNHRFYLLYEKDYQSNSMNDEKYEFAGYFDCIDRILYNPSYNIRNNLFKDDNACKYSYLSELSDQLYQDISDYMIGYALHYQTKLKDEYKEDFYNQEERTFDIYKDDIEKEFINSKELKEISIPNYSDKYKFEHEFNFSNNLIYTEYLDQPKETISKMCNKILKNDEVIQDLAKILLKNDFDNNYLKEILENKDGSFSNLIISRNILNSIKDIDGVNLNITINYGGDSLTFKFPKSKLIHEITNKYYCAWDYKKYYEEVKDFLEGHKKDGYNSNKDSFDFSNITSIAYGKNILYEKQNEMDKDKENKFDKDIVDDMF